MSGVEIAGTILGFVRLLLERILGSAREYRRQRFGIVMQLLSYILIFDTDIVQELHRNINYWSDEELKTWK
jgi:hypothetical protein